MARLALTAITGAAGGASELAGAAAGFVGLVGGAVIDRFLAPKRRIDGPRLEALPISGAAEGAALPIVYGRARVPGRLIWFGGVVRKQQSRGGKGARDLSNADYLATFAVALCEGPIDAVGRIWLNGELVSQARLNFRAHLGAPDQAPDPAITASQGAEDAPAYRDLAYLVFEDFPIESTGLRLPQVSVEVMRKAPPTPGVKPLETLIEGVNMIPASGEFAYAPKPVYRDADSGQSVAVNVNNGRGISDFAAAVADLKAQAPNCRSVSLVCGWLGDDLRAGETRLRPGVEAATGSFQPKGWRVGGVHRNAAHLVSQVDGRPAYGGTPDDASLRDAIAFLKAEGFEVSFYPFIFMDIPENSGLDDPYGRSQQPRHPWRGRITCHPAAGFPGSTDGTVSARTQIESFFGDAEPNDFSLDDDSVRFHGRASDWGLRRMVLHYAHWLKDAGLEAFIIGSELRGLTQVRDERGEYPTVQGLAALARDVRSVLGPDVKLSYAADWSEYFGHHPNDGSGDVRFHLDPLWGDPAIDFVGVDWYGPLSDWRDGGGHLDAAQSSSLYDPGYLDSQVEGGEGFDYWYPDLDARAVQERAPITDGAYDEAWVYRYKDLRQWWSNPHFERFNGVRSEAPTAWVPRSKPIRFTEVGCPAVDKGANQPNVFVDPKSSESFLPYFSNGERDDLIQRRYLEVFLQHWSADGPQMEQTPDGAPMIDWAHTHVWTWDARPFPDFPAQTQIWSDGPNWRLGHWLTGRLASSPLDAVVRDIAVRAGAEAVDVSDLTGLVSGYVLEGPATGRTAMTALAQAYGFAPVEGFDGLGFRHFRAEPNAVLSEDDLVWPENAPRVEQTRGDPHETPELARVRFILDAGDYRIAAARTRWNVEAPGRTLDFDWPLVFDAEQARRLAQDGLARGRAQAHAAQIRAPLSWMALEPGDVVTIKGDDGDAVFRIARRDIGVDLALGLEGAVSRSSAALASSEPIAAPLPAPRPARPAAAVMDLPRLPEERADRSGPLLAAFGDPWAQVDVHAGPSDADARFRARLERPVAGIGRLREPLPPGPVGRWDHAHALLVHAPNADFAAATDFATLADANRVAVRSANGGWEILQARDAELVGPQEWRLSGLLRGLFGTEVAANAGAPVDAVLVALDPVFGVDLADWERDAPLRWRFAPVGEDPLGAFSTLVDERVGGAALKPLSPVRLTATGLADGLRFSWIRRSRVGGDDWVSPEIPLGEAYERYGLEVGPLDGPLRSFETDSPGFDLVGSEFSAVFPHGLSAGVRLRVAQLSDRVGPGIWADTTFSL
ncbi:MAG: glycoside hydrolase/phage tail family protein [Maricaulaceae bacterium]